MNQVMDLHREAMRLAGGADVARRHGMAGWPGSGSAWPLTVRGKKIPDPV
jgi:hypothetical protein